MMCEEAMIDRDDYAKRVRKERKNRIMIEINFDKISSSIDSNHEEDITRDLKYLSTTHFELPPNSKPGEFLDQVWDHPNAPKPIEMAHGTTTLAFVFNGGVIVAVDSKSTQGSYVASRTVKKVIEITPNLLGTMAGGAADCSFWERELGRRCRLYELRNKELISVAAASKILANIVYSYKGYGLSMGTMITGWDKTGPCLYYVDNDGTRLKGQRFSVGSGSTYAYGVLDSGYKPDLTDQEAQELGRRAVYHATHRDAMSGGFINVYHVKETGWVKISSDDCFKLYQKYYNVKPINDNNNNA
ncbi:proteasome subunit beta type 5 [Cavenderia fasciculata]|uniref:Proteasome subunit beta n=1 Tax=Cavenderia fasciculata TaxID=261658 RepID=F4PRF6_CACFS|nr:proteasome subunit beta type 5 [Cavenderia fasciculata]EGG20508.1 proteasome subunit beta type 5 [Cavenderia fasciculata]|eukprot:XP_004358358.1 proteasome subunit beta type 5 [Cavenderia fasciculata]